VAALRFGPHAERILALTATAWREGAGETIPFVEYDSDNRVVSDITFGYGQAVAADESERNVVEVDFQHIEGSVTYQRHSTETDLPLDPTPVTESTNDLGVASSLGPFVSVNTMDDAPLVRDALASGVAHLKQLRLVDPNVGGVVFAKDKRTAKKIRRYMAEDLKVDATLVDSSDPGARSKVKRFREGLGEWLVSVEMITEGTDVPRLKVAVDLSVVMTRRHILQRWGRTVRRMRDSNGRPLDTPSAIIITLSHPKLIRVAEEMKEDIRQARRERGERTGGSDNPPPQFYYNIHSQVKTGVVLKVAGAEVDAGIYSLAEWLFNTDWRGLRANARSARDLIPAAQLLDSQENVPPEHIEEMTEAREMPPRPSMASRKKDLNDELQKAFHVFAVGAFDGDYRRANICLNRRMGVEKWHYKTATEEQIQRRISLCTSGT